MERPTRPRVLWGASPLPSIARVRRRAYPMHRKVTTGVLLGRKRHGCPVAQAVAVGATWVARTPGGLNIDWNVRPCESLSRCEVAGRGVVGSRPVRILSGKADVDWEEPGRITRRPTGIEDQASRKGLAEITSGRAITQQGLAAICKDPPAEAEGRKVAGGFWSGA